jgi:hypothetical protein
LKTRCAEISLTNRSFQTEEPELFAENKIKKGELNHAIKHCNYTRTHGVGTLRPSQQPKPFQ